jgi:GNAT superfamily N-acetyltransferase
VTPTIRSVGPGDYSAVAAILDAVEPEAKASADDLRRSDESIRAGGLVSERLLAETEGRPVGYAVYGQMDWCADPSVWVVLVKVVPEARRRGVGHALHSEVERLADAAGIPNFFAEVREDEVSGAAFAQHLGYERIGEESESWLDLESHRVPDSSAVVPHRLDGIRIQTLAQLRESDSDWFDRFRRLYAALEADIPSPYPNRAVPTVTFRARHVDAPNVRPEGVFIALDGTEWVGLTELLAIDREPRWLQQELTGVVSSHRRRGVATWLKTIALEWARDEGYERIRTSNSSLNEGMLAVNAQLGFVRGTTYGWWARSCERPVKRT